jgi:hypothetical protein
VVASGTGIDESSADNGPLSFSNFFFQIFPSCRIIRGQ